MKNGNRWNRIGHIGLGIAAELIPGLHYYAAKREIDQCPMENDDYPVETFPIDDPPWWVEYWAAPRVLDSLNDTLEVAIGKEIGRWVAWGLMVGVGAWLF